MIESNNLHVATYNIGGRATSYSWTCKRNNVAFSPEDYERVQQKTADKFAKLADEGKLDVLMLQGVSDKEKPLLKTLKSKGFKRLNLTNSRAKDTRFLSTIDNCAILIKTDRFEAVANCSSLIEGIDTPIVIATDKKTHHKFMFVAAEVPESFFEDDRASNVLWCDKLITTVNQLSNNQNVEVNGQPQNLKKDRFENEINRTLSIQGVNIPIAIATDKTRGKKIVFVSSVPEYFREQKGKKVQPDIYMEKVVGKMDALSTHYGTDIQFFIADSHSDPRELVATILRNEKRFEDVRMFSSLVEGFETPCVIATDKTTNQKMLFIAPIPKSFRELKAQKAPQKYAERGDRYIGKVIEKMDELSKEHQADIQIFGADMGAAKMPEKAKFQTYKSGKPTELSLHTPKYEEREVDFIFSRGSEQPLSAKASSPLRFKTEGDPLPGTLSNHIPVMTQFTIPQHPLETDWEEI